MSTELDNNTRRQFLRNTALTVVGIGILPNLASAAPRQEPSAADCPPTTLDYYGQGPFYTAGPPDIQSNQLAEASEPGTRLIVSGVVRNLDCTELIHDTVIDVWHADDAGAYDNVGYNLRGKAYSNAQGFYLFETVQPGKYLNGSQYRPSHIHFKITPPGYPTVITQLYFEGDPEIPNDAAASITSGQYDATNRIIPLTLNGSQYEATWDIIVDGDGTSTGMTPLHLENGMIYSASPNPFNDEVEIKYGLFKPAKSAIHIFDLNGSQVAVLEEQQLKPQKYQAVWRPQGSLPSGHYFIALKVNDLQVHYLKVTRV